MHTKHTKHLSPIPAGRSGGRHAPRARALVATLATTLAAAGACLLAQAATAAPAATAGTAMASTAMARPSADARATTDALLKFSQAGHEAYANIRMARSDLANGRTDAAMAEMKAAQMSLITARAVAPSFATSTQTMVMGKLVGTTTDKFTADAVPVDGSLVLADNFQLHERHLPMPAKAKAHLAKGDSKAAAEVLKQGDIDVSYNRQWLPLASAEKHLDKAISLAAAGHYGAADKALKALEDGVQTDSVRFDDVPATT